MEFNTELKTAFIRRRVTQRKVAQKTGIHVTRISQIVHGRVTPSREERRLLSKALRLSQRDLFAKAA